MNDVTQIAVANQCALCFIKPVGGVPEVRILAGVRRQEGVVFVPPVRRSWGPDGIMTHQRGRVTSRHRCWDVTNRHRGGHCRT